MLNKKIFFLFLSDETNVWLAKMVEHGEEHLYNYYNDPRVGIHFRILNYPQAYPQKTTQ